MAASSRCFACHKLDEYTECQGCVLAVYFSTDDDIEDLKNLCSMISTKEKLKQVLEKIQSFGGNAVMFIGLMSLLAPKYISLKRNVTNQVGELRSDIAELRNEVEVMRGHLDIMSRAIGRLLLRDSGSDDDSLTHVSNTQQSPDGVTCMSASPSGSADAVGDVSESPPATVGHVSKSSPDGDSYVSESPPDDQDG